ncbi:MAG TPA: hypothetical protein VHF47_03450 [Acidimicrobiales bacterium]|nr:hypothetical protein [Acidimicrobiales bacterium]
MSLAPRHDPVPLRPDGAMDPATELHLRVVAMETALATSDRILPPSLRDFLD